ncbi:hypothetical protein MLD52_11400 [Puniceicoccaceae bacterium K14]|nr:hypothetical protein [Puniceicoccaceae bacterium K14]
MALGQSLFASNYLSAQETYSVPQPPTNEVISYEVENFSLEEYTKAAENVISAYEESKQTSFSPGDLGKVGLKVYSHSGAGLSTPENLVEGVVQTLLKRGYERTDIFILGLHSRTLRDAGFLPPLSHRSYEFNQVFVRSLDTGDYYNESWFYDSPLPAQTTEYWINIDEENSVASIEDKEVERKSYLPMPLMHEVDFWINLPCYSDHPSLGINGALLNATLWNASNTVRFLKNPASASVAVAEMGAIPELREKWALNIVSLQHYQFVGGPIFNSLYTASEPLVLLSENPVMLDSMMKDRINNQRKKNGFAPLDEETLKIIAYSEQMGLGEGDTSRVNLIEAKKKQ